MDGSSDGSLFLVSSYFHSIFIKVGLFLPFFIIFYVGSILFLLSQVCISYKVYLFVFTSFL